MAELPQLDSLVAKQLDKLGLSPDRPPTLSDWHQFLDRVSRHYKHVDEGRRLLTRSLELSSGEMAALQARLSAEHGRLRHMISAISDGLRNFHQVIDRVPDSLTDRDLGEVTSAIRQARDRLSQRLSRPFEGERASTWSADEAVHIRREFVFMADQILELLHATVQRATMQKDLEVARAVQRMLMPGREVIDRGWIALAGCFLPAAQCGGDWWSTYDRAGGDQLVVVGDVSGQGVARAIITGVAKAACDAALDLAGDGVTCAELLDMLNSCIAEAAQQTLSMTCVVSILGRHERALTVANAGHSLPLIHRPGGEAPDLRDRVAAGAPLGASPQSWYRAATVELRPGDVVAWYTDGLTWAEDSRGERFGRPRLYHALARAAQRDATGDPGALRDNVLAQLSEFCGADLPGDDVTLVVARVAS